MLNKLALLVVIVAGLAANAHAETYVYSPVFDANNNPINTAGAPCGWATQAQIGLEDTTYWTGDRHYVLVSAQAQCASDTVTMYIQLPPGAVPSPTVQDPVRCTRGRGMTTLAWVGECNANPGFNTQLGRWYVGWTQLGMANSQGGEWVDIRVPVTYNARLVDVANQKEVGILVNGALAPLTPALDLSVTYRAQFKSYASTNYGKGYGSMWGSWDGERVDIAFALHTYFESGSLVIEYGTTPSLGSNLGTTAVPAGAQYYPNVTASFTNLAQNTTYYWRPKYITAFGTFYGDMQSFMTYAYLQIPKPTCTRFPCAL